MKELQLRLKGLIKLYRMCKTEQLLIAIEQVESEIRHLAK